eukprot:scaffold13405_cov58-Attheya_sp.AAC.2
MARYTVANEALRSPWIKIVLRGFSCGGENRTPDLRVDEWTILVSTDESHRMSHRYRANTPN